MYQLDNTCSAKFISHESRSGPRDNPALRVRGTALDSATGQGLKTLFRFFIII